MNNGVNNNVVPQQPVQQQPVIMQAQPVLAPVQQPVQPQPVQTEKKKKKLNISVILLVIILLLVGYIVFINKNYTQTINNIKYNCTPIKEGKETKLDVNSTFVKELYSKVQTSVKEDVANPEFDDNLKLYLAYRQIKEKDKYDSNCNLFNRNSMEPFTCEVSTKFVPKAFKEETIQHEIKKLFGDQTNIPLKNIQLGQTCIVGYQYIKERGEFVEGYCKGQNANLYKAEKQIIKAVSTNTTVTLTEEVKYKSSEKKDLPSYLKSGTYTYVFRLDMNYNYVVISKTYNEKY